jgi:hypothetical protein
MNTFSITGATNITSASYDLSSGATTKSLFTGQTGSVNLFGSLTPSDSITSANVLKIGNYSNFQPVVLSQIKCYGTTINNASMPFGGSLSIGNEQSAGVLNLGNGGIRTGAINIGVNNANAYELNLSTGPNNGGSINMSTSNTGTNTTAVNISTGNTTGAVTIGNTGAAMNIRGSAINVTSATTTSSGTITANSYDLSSGATTKSLFTTQTANATLFGNIGSGSYLTLGNQSARVQASQIEINGNEINNVNNPLGAINIGRTSVGTNIGSGQGSSVSISLVGINLILT